MSARLSNFLSPGQVGRLSVRAAAFHFLAVRRLECGGAGLKWYETSGVANLFAVIALCVCVFPIAVAAQSLPSGTCDPWNIFQVPFNQPRLDCGSANKQTNRASRAHVRKDRRR
jgi:hypothetical protein